MAFGNCESVVDLDEQGILTVTGENLDQGGSNGAGKCHYPETRINIRVKGVIHQITMGELYELARTLETQP